MYSIDGSEVYHIGIIDYLQKYDLGKKIESCLKTIANSSKAMKISAVPVKMY